LTDMKGAGRHAMAAAETTGVNLADDAGIHIVIGGRGRAYRHAWRMTVAALTMLAGSGQITFFGIRKGFAVGQAIDPHPGDAEQFVCVIFSKRDVVFSHTGNRTGTATGTFIQIDDHSEFFSIFNFHLNPIELIIFIYDCRYFRFRRINIQSTYS